MNNTEAAQVVAYLNRAGLVGAMEGQAAVWADALADIPAVTAQQVVREMARDRTSEQRWVTPGDVRAAVTRKRLANLAGMASPQPPASLAGHPGRELDWQRTYRAVYGDTGDAEQAMRAACAALGVEPDRPVLEAAPRPQIARLAAAPQCQCGCLTKPVRQAEGVAR